MFKSMLNIIKNKNLIKAKKDNNPSELNMEIDFNKPFVVVNNDNKVINQFDDFHNASTFAIKLNISYKENGVIANSKVIRLSV